MVSACGLHCSVCQNTFETRKDWFHHLLKPLHQNLARRECLDWDLKVKECVLVAFATFPIAKEDVLQLFSMRDRNTIIADFIWSEHRPRVGILQFESRSKAEEVLEESGRNEVRVADASQLIRLRKATDFMDLEWEELLEKFHYESNEDDGHNWEGEESSSAKATTPPPSTDSSQTSETSLHDQYNTICKSILFPKKDYNLALHIMEKCGQIFASHYPACKLYMFRHWYLNLRNQGTNELLLYLDKSGQIENTEEPIVQHVQTFRLSTSELESCLTSASAQEILPGVRLAQNKGQYFDFRATQFEHEPTNFKFSIMADSHFLTEVQTCRLVKYLMDFDPRVQPFFTLIFYWAKKNSVQISRPVYKDYKKSHAFAPEPAALEWMIITFLARKGIIPKPREILQRAHKQLLVIKTVDVGFSTDSNFSREYWTASASSSNSPCENSDEFYLNLMELVKDFFAFYGKLRVGGWILNTRDAEVISKQDFFDKKPNVGYETGLTVDEICELKKVSVKVELTQVDLGSWVFSMLHPLFLGWCIIFSSTTFFNSVSWKMMTSADILENAIKKVRTTHSGKFSNRFLRHMLRTVNFQRKRRLSENNSKGSVGPAPKKLRRVDKLEVEDDG